ncbi:hypothetical protein N9X96_00145 [bacterium]|nr:hypothetical protein [bacterium]
MQNKPTAFEAIKAGKGRLYPLDREKKLEKYNKLKQYSWFTDLSKEQQALKIPSFNGWLKIDQDVIDEMQGSLDINGGEAIKYNLDVAEQKRDGEVSQLNVEYWLPTKPANKPDPEPAPQQADFPEEDIPF